MGWNNGGDEQWPGLRSVRLALSLPRPCRDATSYFLCDYSWLVCFAVSSDLSPPREEKEKEKKEVWFVDHSKILWACIRVSFSIQFFLLSGCTAQLRMWTTQFVYCFYNTDICFVVGLSDRQLFFFGLACTVFTAAAWVLLEWVDRCEVSQCGTQWANSLNHRAKIRLNHDCICWLN